MNKYKTQACPLVREKIETSGLKMWQVADLLGIRPDALSVKLRHELPLSEQYEIIAKIEAFEAKHDSN